MQCLNQVHTLRGIDYTSQEAIADFWLAQQIASSGFLRLEGRFPERYSRVSTSFESGSRLHIVRCDTINK